MCQGKWYDIEHVETDMIGATFSYAGAILVCFWGIAHLCPTRNIVQGFGDISLDNQRIIAMEWIVEGATLIFIGVLIATVTYVERVSAVSRAVYLLSFAVLNALSLASLLTGFKVAHMPFKLCPFIFTGSSLLILLGSCL